METPIYINHPSTDDVMNLHELSEICFRVNEHLSELWAKYDSLEMDENCCYKLNELFNLAMDSTNESAWRIRHILEQFDELPF